MAKGLPQDIHATNGRDAPRIAQGDEKEEGEITSDEEEVSAAVPNKIASVARSSASQR